MIYTAPLSFHNDVKLDLAAIKSDNPLAHAKLLALLMQLKADRRLAARLLDHGLGHRDKTGLSVSKWIDRWKNGVDLWRLKSWDLERVGLKYRVIYLYLARESRFIVMAITQRDQLDYDDKNHPLRQRIDASLRRSYGIG